MFLFVPQFRRDGKFTTAFVNILAQVLKPLQIVCWAVLKLAEVDTEKSHGKYIETTKDFTSKGKAICASLSETVLAQVRSHLGSRHFGLQFIHLSSVVGGRENSTPFGKGLRFMTS